MRHVQYRVATFDQTISIFFKFMYFTDCYLVKKQGVDIVHIQKYGTTTVYEQKIYIWYYYSTLSINYTAMIYLRKLVLKI